MQIQYIGEHILPGILGRSFVWVGFITALFAAVFYLISFYSKQRPLMFRQIARGLYLVHVISIITVIGILYYLILNHYFEYSYVWQYSSRDLPVKYIISCFWAGQEGSFLVWAIWQALVGLALLILSRKWESSVMTTFALSQAFVTSMLLGVKIGGMEIGSSPFNLLRETMPSLEGTIFAMPDYVRMLGDGNGLNPLLENIWMTIHPPILFLGYALTLVPFSYAVASFMRKDYHTWIGRAMPWALFGLLMLGTGILLGGAWAYVSLTFGGFWAWDPVENSSLVPWMTLVAGMHFMIIARRQSYSLFSAYLMILLTYVLVLYATFLTRSGVLADTSAHSFGENGMTAQLLVFLLAFLVLMVVLLAFNFRKLNTIRKDTLASREFWMFLGALILFLSAFQIIFTTSIPVVNSVFGTSLAPPTDAIGFYNRWQTPFALLIAAFIAITQFLNYQTNKPIQVIRKMAVPFVTSAIVCIFMSLAGIVTRFDLVLLVFFILFGLLSAMYNMIFVTSRPVNIPAVITHAGFVLFMLGVVITFSNSQVISSNTSRYDLGDNRSNEENLVLMRHDTLYMNGYYVSYVSNRQEGNTTHYRVDFLRKKGGTYEHKFSLHPSVNVHPRMGAVYNPDTRRFPDRDFYTYIAIVSKEPDYIVIKTIMNPYINVLWIGSLVMLGGFTYAFLRRARNRWVSGK